MTDQRRIRITEKHFLGKFHRRAYFVIDQYNMVIKDRAGDVPRAATKDEIDSCIIIDDSVDALIDVFGREPKIVTGIPCYPNGQPNGRPREQLPDFLADIWRAKGKPDYQDATNPWREVREEPAASRVREYSAGRSVLQDWTNALSFMMQSVLICAVRGPDGIRKDHPVKVLIRFLRRSFLICAFDGKVRWSPYEPGGGSFTGPLHLRNPNGGEDHPYEHGHIDKFIEIYLRHVDELPHHFQLHLMHAAEILGYKHPDDDVRRFWLTFYRAIVNDAHLKPEPEDVMDKRLGDQEAAWRAAELGDGHGAVAK